MVPSTTKSEPKPGTFVGFEWWERCRRPEETNTNFKPTRIALQVDIVTESKADFY